MDKFAITTLKCFQSSSGLENLKNGKVIMQLLCILIIVALIFNCAVEILGHGMVISPVGRGSRWRIDRTAPVNYDDNGSNCGGFSNQWSVNGGKCGICGDPYQYATPRPHELGGSIGVNGVVVGSYNKNSTIEVTVRITANHLGKFLFDLCNLDYENESEECFARYRIRTSDGRDEYTIGSAVGDYKVLLKLPNISCQHCVLRWQYIAGNNWGWCGDGTGRLGCGPQETFITCSDIKIT